MISHVQKLQPWDLVESQNIDLWKRKAQGRTSIMAAYLQESSPKLGTEIKAKCSDVIVMDFPPGDSVCMRVCVSILTLQVIFTIREGLVSHLGGNLKSNCISYSITLKGVSSTSCPKCRAMHYDVGNGYMPQNPVAPNTCLCPQIFMFYFCLIKTQLQCAFCLASRHPLLQPTFLNSPQPPFVFTFTHMNCSLYPHGQWTGLVLCLFICLFVHF